MGRREHSLENSAGRPAALEPTARVRSSRGGAADPSSPAAVVSIWRGPESTELVSASEPAARAPEPLIELRSDESLVALRAAATNEDEIPWKRQRAWSLLPTPPRGTTLGRAISKLEGMSTGRKVVLVSLPYLLAAALGWHFLGGPDTAVANVPRTTALYAEAPATRTEPAPEAAAAPVVAAPAGVVEPTVAADPPAEAPEKAEVARDPRVLGVASALFSRPSPKARIAAPLASGTRIIVYPDLPAPDGWKVARLPGREIGFVPAPHLSGLPDPRVDAKIAAKSKKKRRDV
ncbi:MAG: hypothetical protein HYV07_20845 [Deltaproteobacteria bacterium]|nr:hypothetical protein [Deltaproteobacteria bacterium]